MINLISRSLDFPSASDPASTTPMTFWLWSPPRTAKPSPQLARPAPSPLTPDSTETRTPTAPSPWSSQRSPPSSSHSSQERSPLRLRPCSMTEQSTSASRTLSKLSPIKRNFKIKPLFAFTSHTKFMLTIWKKIQNPIWLANLSHNVLEYLW